MTKEQKILYMRGEQRERRLADAFLLTRKIVPFEEPMEEGQWYRRIVPGGICADGSEYPILLNRGCENSLVIFLEGGGMSLDEEMARCPNSLGNTYLGKPPCYAANFRPYIEYTCFDNAGGSRGIVEKDDPRNPFRDWHFAVATYGTADLYTGDGSFSYTDEEGRPQTLHHKGYANFLKTLKVLKEVFPDPDRILLMGGSAGAFGVPAVAPDVLRAYPRCRDITVYSDSATCPNEHYIDAAQRVWKAPKRIAGAMHTKSPEADWFEALYKMAGDSLRYLYSISVRDWIFISYLEYYKTRNMIYKTEWEEAFRGHVKETVGRLKRLTDRFHILITDFPFAVENGPDATLHTTCQDPHFYEKTSYGVTPAQWLWDAINKNGYDAGVDLL